MAQARPEINVLAIEVYKPGIAQTLHHLAGRGVDTVRILRADAVPVLDELVAADSLDEVWLFFPDPWPKKKHHKRRIVTDAFACTVASAGPETVDLGLRQVALQRRDETCRGERIGFDTVSWLDDAGRVVASLQFVSVSVAYLRASEL